MTRYATFSHLFLLSAALAGCGESLTPYTQSPNTVIASGYDTGIDDGGLTNGKAAIAYDPDGCQGWVMDGGVEGYAGRRFDPVSGLPVCNNLYPPGTVLGDYRAQNPWFPDFVPGSHASQIPAPPPLN